MPEQVSEVNDQIAKLLKALRYWQGWDAEYEVLKEELEALAGVNEDELRRVRDEYEGDVATKKDLDEIFGQQKLKSRTQVINTLDRRIDYVTDNIKTLQKQLDALEATRTDQEGDELLESADADDGQLTEIIEQLDDNDNVVSYKLNTPSNTLPKVRDALEKAGVKDISDAPSNSKNSTASCQEAPEPASKSRTIPKEPVPTSQSSQPSPKTQVVNVEEPVETTNEQEPEQTAKPAISRNAQRVEQIMDSAKQQESILKENPVVPDDESEEDAALRQEMLKYSMGEVGAIVAQMDIEEMGEHEDDYDFEYSDVEEIEDEDEDAYGRYQGRVITDDYRERMLELEKKLGVKSRFTEAAERRAEVEGESEDDDPTAVSTEGIGRISISQKPVESPSSQKPEQTKSIVKARKGNEPPGSKGKGVRFADNLDIAPETEPAKDTASSVQERPPIVEPLNDTIVERKQPGDQPAAKSTRKPSRFKQAQQEKATAKMDGPEELKDKTLADKLFERETTAQPVPPDEFDDSMIHDEVADEYQRMRRKFIQRDGGFLKEDDRAIRPLDEERGGPQTMSRFKAARLSRQ